MEGLELLRALTEQAGADAAAGTSPPNAVRFIIEYEEHIDIEAERPRIADLVGTNEFEIRELFDDDDEDDDEFGEFYAVQIGGLERTMSQPVLFEMAHELQAALGVITVEPDLGTTVFQEPIEPGDDANIEAAQVGEAFGSLCFVDDPAPVDHRWALEALNVPAAWNHSTGEGILIAQPDTGITAHPEFEPGSISPLQYSVFTGKHDATDPFRKGNKGHGTGTGSVVVSREEHDMAGSAPSAELVPIRCIESVVIAFNAGPVAEAINYARQQGCHVVTMSLGGTPSRAVKKAVKRAVKANMIVLAAAGNCVRVVVWPARYEQVIAVAGSNHRDEVWRGSSRGSDVDITAPGENVWKAVADPSAGRFDVAGGQGTSFATALTAGVAALWLSHWGRDNLITVAEQKGSSVQELFRKALAASARTPSAGWDSDDLGAGIVDAAALLAEPIDGLTPAAPSGRRVESAHLAREVVGADVGDRIEATSPQLHLEISALLLDDARRGLVPGEAIATEAVAGRMPLSRQLQELLVDDPVIDLGERPAMVGTRAPRVSTDAIAEPDPAVLVAPPSPSQLEPVTTASADAARVSLTENRDEMLASLDILIGDDRNDLGLAAREVFDAVADGREIPRGPRTRTGLEALIRMDGSRPAIDIGEGPLEDQADEFGMWSDQIAILSGQLEQRAKSVGRIDSLPGVQAGTGFVVGDGLVLTNRHVIESIAIPAPSSINPTSWIVPGQPTINFSASGVAPEQSFTIVDVVFAGGEPVTGLPFDPAKLDVALVRVETTNDDGFEFPDPLPIDTGPPLAEGRRLFVIGYPGVPEILPRDEEGNRRMGVVRELRDIFGGDYGRKHLSPGLVLTGAQALPDSPQGWTFTHDATSLGGNSGSCVLSADGAVAVVGLHSAGDWLRANFAHDMARIRHLIPGL